MSDPTERPDNPDQQPAEGPLARDPTFVLSRVTLVKDVLTLLGFLLLPGFALRALVVARFDPTTATALVQFTQPVTFLLAFLLEVLPLYIYAVGLGVMFWSGRRYAPSMRGRLALAGAFVSNLVCSVPFLMGAVVPVYVQCATFLFVVPSLAFAAGRHPRSLELGKHPERLLQSARTRGDIEDRLNADMARYHIRTYRLVLVFMSVLTVASARMWLAPEVLTVKGIPRTEYVLQQQDQDLIVYDRGLHAVLRVPKRDVSDRQFCIFGPSLSVSEDLFGSPEGPPCTE